MKVPKIKTHAENQSSGSWKSREAPLPDRGDCFCIHGFSPVWIAFLLVLACSLFSPGCGGCGGKKPPDSNLLSGGKDGGTKSGKTSSGGKTYTSNGSYSAILASGSTVGQAKPPDFQAEEKINSQLEQANAMLRSSNLDGALRLVDRVHSENVRDPNVTMKTWYLRAMIYHRKKEPNKRKEAMNQMLKSMADLQQDPRFQQAFLDGQDCIEVIKKAIEKGGKRYGP